MNQLELNLEPTPKQLCCICKKDIAVRAFHKDWVVGGLWCCDPCNQLLAERRQDHAEAEEQAYQ